MERLQLSLSPVTIAALQKIARDEDVTVGQIVRDAIERDLRRREKAKTPNRADERLVAPLRALLADDFAYSENWNDLQNRLWRKGFRLAEAGGGLVLQRKDGARLCKASELGYSYARLMSRFRAPFPGHSHQSAFRRLAARQDFNSASQSRIAATPSSALST